MARDIVQGLKFRKQIDGFDTDGLAAALEQAYLQQKRPDGFTQKKSFAPSSIGYGRGTCPRYWHLALSGEEFTDLVDAMGVANMANGSAAHERIEKLFEDAGLLVSKEVEIKLSDPPIFGYADVLVRWNGEIVVGEIKTTRQEMFLHRQATMKPSVNHLLQILIYLKATGKRYGFLLYENKNDQTFLVIPVEMTPENAKILEDALDWLRKVYANWKEDGGLPMAPWTKKNKACKECPVFKPCWEKGEGTVNIGKMELPQI